MVSRRGNLEVRPIVSAIIDEKQQLKSTSDAAIGTTRRGTLPLGLYAGLSFSAFITSLQAFTNLNGGENLSHCRASHAI
jgi:hypothetical protein